MLQFKTPRNGVGVAERGVRLSKKDVKIGVHSLNSKALKIPRETDLCDGI